MEDFLGATSVPQAHLAIHNLNIFMREMKLIKEHMDDNSFGELVERKGEKNKKIKKAYEYAKNHVIKKE